MTARPNSQAAGRHSQAPGSVVTQLAPPAPFPSILDMGRHSVIADDAAAVATDMLDPTDSLDDQPLVAFAYERKDAIDDLIMTMPPQTTGDVLVQVGIALHRIQFMEDFENTEAQRDAVLARVRRVMLGALPVLAREAGIDLTAACGSWIAGACEGAFPDLVPSVPPGGAAP